MGHFRWNISNYRDQGVLGKLPRVRSDRRRILKWVMLSGLASAAIPLYRYSSLTVPPFETAPFEELNLSDEEIRDAILSLSQPALAPDMSGRASDAEYLAKVRNFDDDFIDDFYLSDALKRPLIPVYKKITAVRNLVGEVNFNVLSFDEMLHWADSDTNIETFTNKELDFLEMLFHEDAQRYGFLGEKVNPGLTEKISHRTFRRIPQTSQSLYLGNAVPLYTRMKEDVGSSLIVTSGIRGVPKQMQLFLGKAITTKGNLSSASRSVAPPGYSWHGKGDFDVGRYGYGLRNFTSHFMLTPEYRKLIQLGYVSPRYPKDNDQGVRYEPWHIRVA